MKTPRQQYGMSGLSILVVLLLLGFFATCLIKMGPLYMEYLSVKRSVEATIEESQSSASTPRDMKAKLAKKFEINRVESLTAKEVEITRKNGQVIVDSSYEARVPLMFNIDVVLKFDKLIYEFVAKGK